MHNNCYTRVQGVEETWPLDAVEERRDIYKVV